MPNVVAKVLQIIAEVTGDDVAMLRLEFGLFTDLGIDSAAALEIIVGLEDTFDIAISDEEAADAKTLADVVSIVQRLVSKD